MALLFIARASRPDLLHSVSLLAQFNRRPNVSHYKALTHVLAYVKGTLDLHIRYTANGNDDIQFYAGSSHQDDATTRRSTLGYVPIWKGAAIDYHCERPRRLRHR